MTKLSGFSSEGGRLLPVGFGVHPATNQRGASRAAILGAGAVQEIEEAPRPRADLRSIFLSLLPHLELLSHRLSRDLTEAVLER